MYNLIIQMQKRVEKKKLKVARSLIYKKNKIKGKNYNRLLVKIPSYILLLLFFYINFQVLIEFFSAIFCVYRYSVCV